MRKKDIATKKYMSDNVRFADVFNYAIYGGRQIIKTRHVKGNQCRRTVTMEGEWKANSGDRVKGFREDVCHKEKQTLFTCFWELKNASMYIMPSR